MNGAVRWASAALLMLVVVASASCVSVSRRAAPPGDVGDASTTPDAPADVSFDADAEDAEVGPPEGDADVSEPPAPGPSIVPAWLAGASEGEGWRLESVGTTAALRGSSTSVEGWTLRAVE